MQSWTIGLLCYNEEESIEKVLDICYEVLPKMTDNFEVLVINDGSKDNSLSIITDYKLQIDRLVSNPHCYVFTLGVLINY
jgi:glycosyltransferase involved in cell wall biosynthesis